MTAGDAGPLSVLCYDYEIAPLRRLLCDALDEPGTVGGPVGKLLPTALKLEAAIPTQRPAVMLTAAPAAPGTHQQDSMSLPRLADAADIAGLTALRAPALITDTDLPDEDDTSIPVSAAVRVHASRGLVDALPLTVVSLAGGQPVLVHVPRDGKAARVLDGAVRRIPLREILPGMLLAGLDGLTPFASAPPPL